MKIVPSVRLLPVVTFTGLLMASALPARGEWILNGMPISATTGSRDSFGMLPDGDHGAFVAWYERVDGTSRVGVSRISQAGEIAWLTLMPGAITGLSLTPDGAGGVQVLGKNSSGMWIQQLDGGGVVLLPGWKRVSEVTGVNSTTVQRLADGTTQIVWVDPGVLGGNAVFGQRLDAQGDPLWEAAGRQLVPPTKTAYNDLALIPGIEGAFFLAWNRSAGDAGDAWINGSVARFDAAGAPGTASLIDYTFHAASDGAGGAMVVSSTLDVLQADIFSLHLNADGTSGWGRKAVSTATGRQYAPRLVPDGLGGAIVVWDDYRSGLADIYAQRVDSNGDPQWTNGGQAVVTGAGPQTIARIIADGFAGVIIAWRDEGKLYAQRLGPGGEKLWDPAGVSLVSAQAGQAGLRAVLDGNGGVIFAWEDFRNNPTGFDGPVYAQRLSLADGAWGSPVPVAISSFDVEARRDGVWLQAVYRSNLAVTAVNVYRSASTSNFVRIASTERVAPDRFEFLDRSVEPGASYRYQIGVVDAEGEYLSPIERVTVPSLDFALEQNQPNPFNPETRIRFVVPARESAVLSVYSADGRLVRTLFDGIATSGSNEVSWDGRDNRGLPVGSGVYFYRLSAGKHTATRKMALLK